MENVNEQRKPKPKPISPKRERREKGYPLREAPQQRPPKPKPPKSDS